MFVDIICNVMGVDIVFKGGRWWYIWNGKSITGN